MRVFIYNGGLRLVGKSGVGQAILHQREMLRRARIDTADHWCQRAGAVHINTVLPDSVLAALAAKLMGRKVIYYGHSTMEDFRRSFRGSDRLAPLFRKWITFCYSLGDVVLTPTEYSRRLLESYGLKPPVYSISNGVDTEFFAPDPTRRASFRRRWGLREGDARWPGGGADHRSQDGQPVCRAGGTAEAHLPGDGGAGGGKRPPVRDGAGDGLPTSGIAGGT